MDSHGASPSITRGRPLPVDFLYVPADRPDRFDKARSHASAVIVDLEDAVAPTAKAQARAAVTEAFADRPSPHVWVRIDPLAGAADRDVVAAVGASIAGVILAKADEDHVGDFVRAVPGVPLIALVESARGLADLDRIAAYPSVVTFATGEVDLLADLRMARVAGTAHSIDTLRLQLILAAARNRLSAPLAPTSTDFVDLDAFTASSRHLRALGYRSRTAIHPSQCAAIRAAFAPTEDEIEDATDVVSRFERAGGGVALDGRGRLIDAAVVRNAVEILANHRRQEHPR